MTNETTASQPKSIGDDAQFRTLTRIWRDNARVGAGAQAWADLVDHIDSKLRAPADQASATIQAAPVGWTAKRVDGTGYGNILYSDRQSAEIAISHNGPAAPKYEIVPVFAATIQEPVMVAEPMTLAGFFAEAKRLGCKIPADIATQLAAPMVADPAGVATSMRNELIKECVAALELEKVEADVTDEPTDHSYNLAISHCIGALNGMKLSEAATVKAVPSEALEGACTVCKGKGCDHCDGMGLEPRKVVGYAECRCILKQYCDGQCRPIFADQQPVTRAAPLADKTGGGE